MIPYHATTRDIEVTVRPVYLDGQSDIMERKFVFGYFVRIENHGVEPIQLMRRHWFITDETGNVQEVEGEGVIGQQPVIEPGGAHQYNSFSVLQTFTGTMRGYYLMERSRGERFKVDIPQFDLKAAVN